MNFDQLITMLINEAIAPRVKAIHDLISEGSKCETVKHITPVNQDKSPNELSDP